MKNGKKEKKGLVVLAVALVVSIAAVSYAVFNFSKAGTNDNEITTGTLLLTLDESTSDGISLLNAVPVNDSEGLNYTPYTFTLKNTGTLSAAYTVKLVYDEEMYTTDGCSDKRLDMSNVKYSYTIDDGTATTELLSSNNGLIDTGVLAPDASKSYTLRLWIKSDATNEIMGQHYHGIIQVDAEQAEK